MILQLLQKFIGIEKQPITIFILLGKDQYLVKRKFQLSTHFTWNKFGLSLRYPTIIQF